jgi:uncharacterized lipoprotein NlpE involved in copper resistance
MHDPLNSPPVLARPFITLALVMIGLTGCSSGGGGSPSVVAAADNYYVNNPGDTITVSAPGVLQNDSGSGLTAELVGYSGPPGTLTFNANGSFTYTHNATATAFNYRAVNGTSSSMATVTISINQPPVANNSCASTPVNTPVAGALSATDPEGQSLTYALAAQGGKGTVNIDISGNYSYTPNSPSLRGVDKFTYQVTDAGGKASIGSAWVLIDGAVRIMPLGDSITAGELGNGSTEAFWVSYRRKLYNDLSALNPAQFGVNFVGSVTTGASASPPLGDLDNEGHDGWCDDNNPFCTVSGGANIAASVNGFLNNNPADIILLHIGTNHFNTDNSGVDTILNNISTWAQANHPVTVFVARIIPARDGSLDVNTFNNAVAAIAIDRPAVKVYMVNQQAALQLPGLPNNADPALMGNILHPNQTGYDKMADTWKADLTSLGALPSCP